MSLSISIIEIFFCPFFTVLYGGFIFRNFRSIFMTPFHSCELWFNLSVLLKHFMSCFRAFYDNFIFKYHMKICLFESIVWFLSFGTTKICCALFDSFLCWFFLSFSAIKKSFVHFVTMYFIVVCLSAAVPSWGQTGELFQQYYYIFVSVFDSPVYFCFLPVLYKHFYSLFFLLSCAMISLLVSHKDFHGCFGPFCMVVSFQYHVSRFKPELFISQ